MPCAYITVAIIGLRFILSAYCYSSIFNMYLYSPCVWVIVVFHCVTIDSCVWGSSVCIMWHILGVTRLSCTYYTLLYYFESLMGLSHAYSSVCISLVEWPWSALVVYYVILSFSSRCISSMNATLRFSGVPRSLWHIYEYSWGYVQAYLIITLHTNYVYIYTSLPSS